MVNSLQLLFICIFTCVHPHLFEGIRKIKHKYQENYALQIKPSFKKKKRLRFLPVLMTFKKKKKRSGKSWWEEHLFLSKPQLIWSATEQKEMKQNSSLGTQKKYWKKIELLQKVYETVQFSRVIFNSNNALVFFVFLWILPSWSCFPCYLGGG